MDGVLPRLYSVDMRHFCAPCLTYVVMRLGLPSVLDKMPDGIFHMLQAPCTALYSNDTELYMGDVVVWYTEGRVAFDKSFCRDATVCIDSAGRIQHHPVPVGVHFGVVEQVQVMDTVISDCVIPDDASYPTIRYRLLRNITKPSVYIRNVDFCTYAREVISTKREQE